MEVYNDVASHGLQRTLSSLSSEKVSTMIPNTILLNPIVVIMMKKDRSNRTRRPDVSNFLGTSGSSCMRGGDLEEIGRKIY